MIPNLVEVYCLAANLTSKIDEKLKKTTTGRKPILSRAEYITLAIIKQERCIRTNKDLYELVKYCMARDFPPLPSYQQFCEGLESNFLYLMLINQILCKMNVSSEEAQYIVDSTALPICKTIYSNSAKVGLGLANYGKNLEGWFFGFKLHIIITSDMDIVSFKFSKASSSDLSNLDKHMTDGLIGYLFGDKGYISAKKTKELLEQQLKLITRPRKNMKKLPVESKLALLLAIRQRVETVFGQLKDNFMLICRKARSVTSFLSSTLAALFAYTLKKKPCFLTADSDLFTLPSIS
jgi:Transposase DDE domain